MNEGEKAVRNASWICLGGLVVLGVAEFFFGLSKESANEYFLIVLGYGSSKILFFICKALGRILEDNQALKAALKRIERGRDE